MAARLDEVAEGLAAVLATSATPEPLRIDMRNQSPVNMAFFVRALAAACARHSAPLAVVRVDRELGERLVRSVQREPLDDPEVTIELADELGASLEVFRHRPTQDV